MRWHEPDESRGSRPESVSASGCKSPGRFGTSICIERSIPPGKPSVHCDGPRYSGVALILDIDLKLREQPSVAGEVLIL